MHRRQIRPFLNDHRLAIGFMVTIQFLLCLAESIGAMKCHAEISDCGSWEWFFAFVVNLPFSILIEQVYGLLPGSIVINHFEISVAIRFIVYMVGGSFWWLAVFVIFRKLRYLGKSNPEELEN